MKKEVREGGGSRRIIQDPSFLASYQVTIIICWVPIEIFRDAEDTSGIEEVGPEAPFYMLIRVETEAINIVLLYCISDPILEYISDDRVVGLDVGQRKDRGGFVIPELTHFDRGLVGIVHQAGAVEVPA